MQKYLEAFDRLLSMNNLVTKTYTDSEKELYASLGRVKAFLKELGNPHELFGFVHIAGTSGKGSVANMMHHLLLEDGRKVATYTSPHTTTYLERFQFGDGLLKPLLLTTCIDELLETYQHFIETHDPLSFFELSLCLALLSFKKAGAEWVVLETGCGGRFDATNIIPTPDVAIITNIGKDHTDILGDSLVEIASKKAGIIKKRGVVVCGEVRPKLKKVFKDEAVKHHAALFFVPPPAKALVSSDLGESQQHNAALARHAAHELGISENRIKKTFARLKNLPCRFEVIQSNPTVILDGAHSPAKMASTVKLIKKQKKNVHVLFGSVLSKDAEAQIKMLAPVVKTISTTRFTTTFRKAHKPSELLKLVPPKKRGQAFLDPFKALDTLLKELKNDDVLLVTGSLYLAGELRTKWISEKHILKNASSY